MGTPLPHFSFATAAQIHFGCGCISQLADEAAKLGSSVLLVTGANPERVEQATAGVRLPTTRFSVGGEPDTNLVERGVALGLEAGCDVVVAIGGGSVIDAGKAISALLTNPGRIDTYLEVVGKGMPLSSPAIPLIAVPTTAGTGAEVTRNAVLSVPDHGVKVSMRSEWMLPKVAIVDPLLTVSVSPQVTAATGLDALTQVIEPYISKKSNPLTDALCETGIARIARSLKTAFDDGTNIAAREDMALGSLIGGLALANAGLGAVHGFAGPMGGMFPIAHGAICGRLLPFVFRANAEAAMENPGLLAKFTKIAQLLTGNPAAIVTDGIDWLEELCAHLKVDGLATRGVTEAHFDALIEAATRASSMKGNPIDLPLPTLRHILQKAL